MFTATLDNGVVLQVYFDRAYDDKDRPRYTICHIVDKTPGTIDPEHIVAISSCNYDAGQRWDAKRGRMEALKKALPAFGISRQARRDVIWPLFFEKSNQPFLRRNNGAA